YEGISQYQASDAQLYLNKQQKQHRSS
ncbi:hypothetical protein, partial [Salmonella enterica]